ncbi:MAG: response regulator transcription factor [Gemmatimonadales bacterium]|nr:response regulator transcription factor [Gemmatimonadales bacterium]
MIDLRVVVVDDEPLAREGLVELLEAYPGVTVVGAFADAAAALAGLERVRPDVLFVDVQMPGLNGFELVEALTSDPLPGVVFVTAYDEYAIRAFEVNAIDYLLKPVTAERLGQAIERVGAHVRGAGDRDYRASMAALLKGLPERAQGAGRLIVREVGQIVVVPTRDVDWIEGADYYCKLHCGAKVHLLRETLGSLEQRLDSRRFMRVHRSAIVNLARVGAVEAHLRGEGIVVLTSGTRVKVTRSRREELERRLEDFHDTE